MVETLLASCVLKQLIISQALTGRSMSVVSFMLHALTIFTNMTTYRTQLLEEEEEE